MTADKLMAMYGRSSTYNNSSWEFTCGALSGTEYNKFKSLADAMFPNYLNKKVLTLPDGSVLDVPHFWAALDGIISDYPAACGWGGDLMQLAQDIKNGATPAFPSGQFGADDWTSDADAHNITKNSTYVPNLRNYWDTINEKKRVQQFTSNGQTVQQRLNNLTRGWLLPIYDGDAIDKLKSNFGVSDTHVTQACNVMQAYLDNVKNS